jgi:hypothetical protein
METKPVSQKPATPAPVTTQPVVNPFQRTAPAHVNAGTTEIEIQRAVAEVQASLMIAKARPRDQAQAFLNVIESCRRPQFASKAFYSYPKGGQTVTGPSIRFAEELARLWGNMEYGMRELSNRDGETEMEAFCWDYETNTRSSQRFVVKHVIDTRGGAKQLTEQRDIYEVGANMGSRRVRARILAVLPPDLVEAAVEECRRTISGEGQGNFADRVKNMLKAFSNMGVTKPHIEARIGKPVAEILPDEFTDLIGIYNSMKDGMSKASEWFGQAERKPEEGSTLDALAKASKKASGGPKPPQQEDKPAPGVTPEPNGEELV